jgi:hypothetical protein
MRNISEVGTLNNIFRKVFNENNLIIIIPAVFVILVIVGFMIYGFRTPSRIEVSTKENLIEIQRQSEIEMFYEYEDGIYDENSPFFIINPYGISPLTALIMFETEESESFKLVVKGKTEEADFEYISTDKTYHQIPVYGLYLGSNTIELYRYNQITETEIELVYSKSFNISHPEDMSKLPTPTSIDTTYEYFGDDLMLLTSATASSYTVAYDYNGDIRWYANVPLGFSPDFLENGHLIIGSDRIISDPYYNISLYEMDLTGKIYKEYYLPGGYHHDLVELDNDNLLVLTNDFNGTVEDVVVELDRTTGIIVKTWDISDYIPMFEGPAEMWTADDWFHNNSIDYDKDTDSIILSGRHQDAVISIGYSSNELNWILGDPANWEDTSISDKFFTPIGDNFEWQYAQHGAIVLPNGNIFLFDNGNNKSKDSETYIDAIDSYSRGVIYDINTDTMEITQVYEYGKELGYEFYSPYISNVAYYDEDYYMIHSGGISSSSTDGPLNIPAPLYRGEGVVTMNSITIEIKDDDVVYRLEVASNFYRAVRMTPYNDTTSFSLSVPEVLGFQNATPVYSGTVEKSLTIFKNVSGKYELSLEKQTDRLVIEGIFNRYDEIYLILQNDNGEIVYYIPTSRTAYTAMCTSVYENDSRFLTFYINEVGVDGTYSVYLNINGHKYDTYQEVVFK